MESSILFRGYGIPVSLANDESFLLVRETLTRIGIASRKDKTLFPSCLILHKKGYYHLMHFKEMFLLDGRTSDISENDLGRRNAIALLLQDWELLKILDESMIGENVVDLSQIKILAYKEKHEWNISPKYSVGSKKFNQ